MTSTDENLKNLLLKSYLAFLGKDSQTISLQSDDFVELHFHTEHSALDGATRVEEVGKLIKSNGQTAVAITDHGTMSGVFDVYKSCKKQGIKLIPAMEPYIVEDLNALPPTRRRKTKKKENESQEEDEEKNTFTSLDRDGHLILLAKNETGYRNLLQLHYIGYQNRRLNTYGRVIPRLDFETLRAFKEGIIVGTACIASLIGQSILKGNLEKAEEFVLWFKKEFGDDFYLELQPVGLFRKEKERLLYRCERMGELESLQVKVNKQLVTLALKHNIPICVTSDAHYAKREDRETHALLLAIQSKKDITDDTCFFFPASYALTVEELSSQFPNEWIKNTKLIADKCEQPKYLEFGKDYKIPVFPVPKNKDFEIWKKEFLEQC